MLLSAPSLKTHSEKINSEEKEKVERSEVGSDTSVLVIEKNDHILSVTIGT